MGLFDFWKKNERLDEEIKAFHGKIEKTPTQSDIKNKRGEGFDDLQLVQGYGNIGLSSFNLFYRQYINKPFENELARIYEYRRMAETSEISDIIEDAVNESTQENSEGETLTLEIEDEKLKKNENIMNNLQEEFNELFYNRIDINNKIWDIFRSYYIDGRVYYERIIDKAHQKNGIIGIKKLPSESMDYFIDPFTGNVIKFFQYISEKPKRPATVEEAEQSNDIIVFDPNQISFINYGVYGQNKYEILGYLEKAKVPYNQLKLLETSVIIYRIVRSPERLVFRIDTGAMPMDRAMKFVEKVKNKMTRKQSFNPNTGALTQEADVFSLLENYYLPQCLRLDTRIDLLDSRTLTLKEIIDEHEQGIKHEVYSVDQSTGKILRGEVEWAGITRKNAELTRVWLDNDEYVDVTPDHRFVLRDGSECKAEELTIGQSLMPLYKRTEKINKNSNDYEQVFDLRKNKWLFTHRITGPLPKRGMAIHHKDFNRFNNMNDNLVSMPIKEHIELHCSTNRERKSYIPMLKALNKPEVRKRQREAASKAMIKRFRDISERENLSNFLRNRWANDVDFREKVTSSAKRPKTEDHKKALSESVKDRWANDEEYRKAVSKSSKERWFNEDYCKMMSERQSCVIDEKCRYFIVLETLRNNFSTIKKTLKSLNNNTEFIDHWHMINIDRKNVPKDKISVNSFNKIIKSFGFENYDNFKGSITINHKVKKVEKLSVREDTGCLTIKDPRGNHNFALAAGIFVKNSGDGRGSQIDSVGGNSQGFTELSDIYYFARKLYRSLKYPLSRVSAGEEKREADILFGGNQMAEISRDEIKWAKFLERQQKRMCDDFRDVFMLHLKFKGLAEQYSLKTDDIEVKLNSPSHYKEQMDQAFITTSFDNYNALADRPEVSKYFAMKEWLHWDDEKIRENVAGFAKDKELGLVKGEEGGGGYY